MVDTEEFKQLMRTYKLTRQKTATLLHVSKTALDKWLTKKALPLWAMMLLQRKVLSPIVFPTIANPTQLLKEIVSAQKISKVQLADFIGVNVERVYQWTTKKTTPIWAVESLMLALLLDNAVINKMKQCHFEIVRANRFRC